MINVGKIFIPKKPKQVEVSLSSDTKRVIEIHNKNSQEELELQKKQISLEEENLKTKDRVNISLTEYNDMKNELEYLSKIKEAYLNLIKPVINSHELSYEIRQKICDGKINFAKFIATPDYGPCMDRVVKVALYFTVEEEYK